MVRQLYHMGVIEAYTGQTKKKDQDKVSIEMSRSLLKILKCLLIFIKIVKYNWLIEYVLLHIHVHVFDNAVDISSIILKGFHKLFLILAY